MEIRHRWRYYATHQGRRPVHEFLDGLGPDDRATVVGAMRIVRQVGLHAARHVVGDLYEIRVAISDRIVRVLFAQEGRQGALAKPYQVRQVRQLFLKYKLGGKVSE